MNREFCKHYRPAEVQKGGFIQCPKATATLSLTITQLISAKTCSGRRKVYTASLKHYLTRFAVGRVNVSDVTTEDIESWLASHTGNSRATWLNRISTLFSFAVKRGIITQNPCARIERQRIDRKVPAILTPAQAEALYQLCPTNCRPSLVLGLYVGLRPEEAANVDWADIHLDHETPTVRVNHSKTRQPRIVELLPKAVMLLRAHPITTGPIAPSASTMRRFKRRARTVLDGEWKADILRHTAASYLIALKKDVGVVSTLLGNSGSILLRHYHTPVSAEDCAKFWAV